MVGSGPDAHAPDLGVRAAWLARPPRRPPWRTGSVDRLLEKVKKEGEEGGKN
jgi:hypothetical protein